MIIVRKRGDGMEFEFPTILDESGTAQRIHLGSESGNDDAQRIDLAAAHAGPAPARAVPRHP